MMNVHLYAGTSLQVQSKMYVTASMYYIISFFAVTARSWLHVSYNFHCMHFI